MSDSEARENVLSPASRNRAGRIGDVPDGVQGRYYTDERGGPGLGFYVDATVQRAAFRDRGDRLATDRADPNAIRDMAEIARHRGWRIVMAKGSAEFRREAWLAGRRVGLEVRGYRPTERDLQALERTRPRSANRNEQTPAARSARQRADAGRDIVASSRPLRGEAQLRVVEAVVRARVQDEDKQRGIIDRARMRIADWLERGADFRPEQEMGRRPERQRSR